MWNGPSGVGQAGSVLSPMSNHEKAHPRNPEKTRRIRVDTADALRYGMIKPRTVHDYLVDPRMVEYVEKLDSSMVKRAVLITSCASKKHRQDLVRDALVRNGIQVAPGEFICRGSFLFLGAGHPNRKDINDAISFVRKVTE